MYNEYDLTNLERLLELCEKHEKGNVLEEIPVSRLFFSALVGHLKTYKKYIEQSKYAMIWTVWDVVEAAEYYDYHMTEEEAEKFFDENFRGLESASVADANDALYDMVFSYVREKEEKEGR